MEKISIQEITDIIQSSNLNFLLGAGASTPFLPLLGGIEDKLNAAVDRMQRESVLKEYLSRVMLPNKNIILQTEQSDDYKKTSKSYDDFFLAMSEVIVNRKSTILSKQVNIFTTNIDILIEQSFERLLIEYNDGFSGKFKPTFSPANYKKSIQQRSLHYDHVSEIPVFNVIKIHGSLTWQKDSEKILFSHHLDHFSNDLLEKTETVFLEGYKKRE